MRLSKDFYALLFPQKEDESRNISISSIGLLFMPTPILVYFIPRYRKFSYGKNGRTGPGKRVEPEPALWPVPNRAAWICTAGGIDASGPIWVTAVLPGGKAIDSPCSGFLCSLSQPGYGAGYGVGQLACLIHFGVRIAPSFLHTRAHTPLSFYPHSCLKLGSFFPKNYRPILLLVYFKASHVEVSSTNQ